MHYDCYGFLVMQRGTHFFPSSPILCVHIFSSKLFVPHDSFTLIHTLRSVLCVCNYLFVCSPCFSVPDAHSVFLNMFIFSLGFFFVWIWIFPSRTWLGCHFRRLAMFVCTVHLCTVAFLSGNRTDLIL